jgi:hypothetical protein
MHTKIKCRFWCMLQSKTFFILIDINYSGNFLAIPPGEIRTHDVPFCTPCITIIPTPERDSISQPITPHVETIPLDHAATGHFLKRLPRVGSEPGSSQFHLFSHFHHFTAEPQRRPCHRTYSSRVLHICMYMWSESVFLAAWHSGHRVRFKNRRSRVRIPGLCVRVSGL